MRTALRSHKWFYGEQETAILHQGALRSAGIDMDNYSGQPIIGIANTWGELNNCNMSLRRIAEFVKAGVMKAGGIPLEFPVMTLGEELMKPSAMLYRNLLSLEVEENLRAYPIDGVILLGNCDKTVPGLLMGAVSSDLPAIQLNAGPKKAGFFNGKQLGSGTDLWKYWDELRKGRITQGDWEDIGKALSCGFGSCNTMGTASTMNGLLEGLGMMPLGLSSLPVDSEVRFRISGDAGMRIVDMVREDLRPSKILTAGAFRNAVALCMALGGSTNAIIHLTAIAGRRNIPVYPELFDELGSAVPCIADVQPTGTRLMDEFDRAGGIPAVLRQLGEFLDLSALTFTGTSLGSMLGGIRSGEEETIRPLTAPVKNSPTIAILKGNLAPDGAVIKVAAASSQFLVHSGQALVFDNYEEMLQHIDDPDLPVDETTVLVLRNAGPVGVPGMPEWGMIPVPRKLQLQGISDMVRISDSRMSGTSYGTVILHIAPEAALGGPLALVRSGDIISLDIGRRSLRLEVSVKELSLRKKSWKAPARVHRRGYPKLYMDQVLQANEGCDFAFLKPGDQQVAGMIEPRVGRS